MTIRNTITKTLFLIVHWLNLKTFLDLVFIVFSLKFGFKYIGEDHTNKKKQGVLRPALIVKNYFL